MTDESNTQNGAAGNSTGTSSAGTQNTEANDNSRMIPVERFNEVNKRMRDAEAALAKFTKDTSDAEAARLQKQGEWQQIAENEKRRAAELETKAARADVLEKMYVEENTARIEKVPDDRKSLIPVDYQPERLSKWLTTNWDWLTVKPAPSTDAGAGGGKGTTLPALTPLQRSFAQAGGMSEKEYAEELAKSQRESALNFEE